MYNIKPLTALRVFFGMKFDLQIDKSYNSCDYFVLQRKSDSPLALVGTVWMCTSTNEPDASYYKLIFANEGPSRRLGKIQFSRRGSQSFFRRLQEKKRIFFTLKKKMTSLWRFMIKNQITAVLDGQKMSFQ